jgi:hypothetical protein
VGRVLEQIGLAIEDAHCPLGWTPTRRLIWHVANRATQPLPPSNAEASDADIGLVRLLLHAARVNADATINSEAECLDVLTALGLFRSGRDGCLRATPLLLKLLVLHDSEEIMDLKPDQNKNPGRVIPEFRLEVRLR